MICTHVTGVRGVSQRVELLVFVGEIVVMSLEFVVGIQAHFCTVDMMLHAILSLYITATLAVKVPELSCNYRDDNASRDASDSDDEDQTGNPDELGSGDVDASDTTVCGTDGRTYPSVCHLLQNTINEHVLHAGRCNANQCRGGPVRNVL